MFISQSICIYFTSMFSLIMARIRPLILSFWMDVVRPHILSVLSCGILERDQKEEQEQNIIKNAMRFQFESFLYGFSPGFQISGSKALYIYQSLFSLIYCPQSYDKATSKELSESYWRWPKVISSTHYTSWLRISKTRKGHLVLISLSQ